MKVRSLTKGEIWKCFMSGCKEIAEYELRFNESESIEYNNNAPETLLCSTHYKNILINEGLLFEVI